MIRRVISDLFDGLLQITAVFLAAGLTGAIYIAVSAMANVSTLGAIGLAMISAVASLILTALLLGPIFVLLDIRDSLRRRV